MRKVLFISFFFTLSAALSAQTAGQKLQKAFRQFEADPQLKYAISSLYVIDAKTGQVVFDKNSQIGLAPASTQKIITAATAFELLGKDYQYKTELGYTGNIREGRLEGELVISGSGDPTLGSWRYASATDSVVLREWAGAVSRQGIKSYGRISTTEEKYFPKNIPDGWIWQDIGNYYGAGAFKINWRENQYDLILSSGNNTGAEVTIEAIVPSYFKMHSFVNRLRSGEKGSGDNAYIYLYNGHYVITGTIPRAEKSFKVSGAMIYPPENLEYELTGELLKRNIRPERNIDTPSVQNEMGEPFEEKKYQYAVIDTHYSPSLDSVIYWFLQKSINLYGEALIRTLGKDGSASTDSGIVVVKNLWEKRGINENELNIFDGSGLSPQNRVTTHAQVEILKYAKKQSWFPGFYRAFPDYNNMKMKSGTIRNVKGFCGYHKAKDGKEYIFSFLVNNYNGSASGLVSKMYRVLNVLK